MFEVEDGFACRSASQEQHCRRLYDRAAAISDAHVRDALGGLQVEFNEHGGVVTHGKPVI